MRLCSSPFARLLTWAPIRCGAVREYRRLRSAHRSADLPRTQPGKRPGKTPRPMSRSIQSTQRAQPVSCFAEKAQVVETADRDQSKSAQVPPHIAALRGIKIERRGRPTLDLEDGPEQKRAKTHHNARLLCKRRDPHRRRVGIGGGEIEPEVENIDFIMRFP